MAATLIMTNVKTLSVRGTLRNGFSILYFQIFLIEARSYGEKELITSVISFL
jgi:hypothetical protein